MRTAQILVNALRQCSLEGYGLGELIERAAVELERQDNLLNTPSVMNFLESVQLEVAYQDESKQTQYDEFKVPEEWFWTVSYLMHKAVIAQLDSDLEKTLHHTISSAAVLSKWHDKVLKDKEAELSRQ